MDEVFRDFRDIIINDVGDVRNIDAAGGYVRGDEDAVMAFREAFEGLIALRLRAVSVNLRGRVTGADETGSYAICTMLGANEDQKAATLIGFK